MKSFKSWLENKYNKNDKNENNKSMKNKLGCECRCIPCSKHKDCSRCDCKDCKCKGCKCSQKPVTKKNNPKDKPEAKAEIDNKPKKEKNKKEDKLKVLDSFKDKLNK